MNSPGPFCNWTRSILRTFSAKRRGMHHRGYYIVPLSEHLMPCPQLLRSCSILQCNNQKRFFIVKAGSRGECKNEFKCLSGFLNRYGGNVSVEWAQRGSKVFSTSAALPATAAFTTHGEGDVDMGSKEFIHNLETYSRYQPCPVSIGNLDLKVSNNIIQNNFAIIFLCNLLNHYISSFSGIWAER